MSTLSTAITSRQWDLAAHLLILAALQTLNDEGGSGAHARKKRRQKGQAKRPS